MRVVVVGAGAAGLASARQVIAEGLECEVLEIKSEIGGTWVYTPDVGNDKDGFPVYSATYKDLKINVPKEVMGFPNFPIPEQEKSYLTQAEVLEFLNQYVDHFKLRPVIKINRMVTEIRPIHGQWQVKSVDKPSRQEIVATYDAVMVSVGNCNEPIMPNIPGIEKFKGNISHSCQFRISDSFTNQKVLIIGGGPSGFDLAQHISSVAEYVVFSHHNEIVDKMEFPPNVIRKPDVLRVKNENEVEFTDKSCNYFDAIVYCTGYKYSYPFLHDTCGVTVEENYVQPLYKQIIHIDQPTIGFIGIPIYVCPFHMFDLQARFFCTYLTGKKSLPTPEEMRADTEKYLQNRLAMGYPKKKVHLLAWDQEGYYEDLAITAELDRIKPVFINVHKESLNRLYNDFQNFREDRYHIIDDENFIRM